MCKPHKDERVLKTVHIKGMRLTHRVKNVKTDED